MLQVKYQLAAFLSYKRGVEIGSLMLSLSKQQERSNHLKQAHQSKASQNHQVKSHHMDKKKKRTMMLKLTKMCMTAVHSMSGGSFSYIYLSLCFFFEKVLAKIAAQLCHTTQHRADTRRKNKEEKPANRGIKIHCLPNKKPQTRYC